MERKNGLYKLVIDAGEHDMVAFISYIDGKYYGVKFDSNTNQEDAARAFEDSRVTLTLVDEADGIRP